MRHNSCCCCNLDMPKQSMVANHAEPPFNTSQGPQATASSQKVKVTESSRHKATASSGLATESSRSQHRRWAQAGQYSHAFPPGSGRGQWSPPLLVEWRRSRGTGTGSSSAIPLQLARIARAQMKAAPSLHYGGESLQCQATWEVTPTSWALLRHAHR